MSDDPYEAGLQVRREVLGEDHVARATAAVTDLDAAFQRYITETAWGSLWTRDDRLDRRTRSCITIALLTALRAEHELGLHIGGGLRNGLTPDDIAEVILHTSAYVGIPAANTAMAVAKRVLSAEATSTSTSASASTSRGAGTAPRHDRAEPA